MKQVLACLFITLSFALAGCGGGSDNKAVAPAVVPPSPAGQPAAGGGKADAGAASSTATVETQ